MKRPLVSVVMPAWQAEPWLEVAMTSILTQSYRELELIVVDDASTDRTPDIVRAFADSRVRHLRLDVNAGVGTALNHGLAAAHGELVARMDSDDIALSHRLATQVDYLAAHPEVAMIAANVHLLDVRGRTLGRAVMWHGRALHWALHMANVIFHPTVMLRRDALPAGGYPAVHSRSEDWMMWLALIRGGHRIATLDEPLCIYRRHAGAVTAGPPRVTIAREMQDHLTGAIGYRPELASVSAWVGRFTVGGVEDARDLARLARALAPDRLAASALGNVPGWTPAGLRRARRSHAKWVLMLARAALSARRRDVAAQLAMLVPGALARALSRP